MALTVETGSGSSTADALASLAFVNTYHTDYGNSDWTGSDDDKEAAIRRATSYLSDSFDWQGFRANNRDQALTWPRSGVIDHEGIGIDSDEIPIEIQNAVAEIARQELITPNSMNPVFTRSEAVKSEKIGQISVEYLLASPSADDYRPVLIKVRDMIGQFLRRGSGSRLSGGTYRV